MKTFELIVVVTTGNEAMDWATVDDYAKRKLEEDGDLVVHDIIVKEV